MRRVDQAMRWWHGNVGVDGRIFRSIIPERHRKVLVKNNKIQFNYGITTNRDYYTLR